MDNTSLSAQLRNIGFAPPRGSPYAKPYPFNVDINERWDSPITAQVLGFKRGLAELSEALRRSMYDYGIPNQPIEQHPTFQALQHHLPSQSRTESRNGKSIFTHYDRIGLYRDKHHTNKQLVGLAHVRYVAIVPDALHSKRFTPWEGVVVCQAQLLNAWVSSGEEVDFAVKAIQRRFLDHIEAVGNAALAAFEWVNEEDDEPTYYPIPIIAESQYPYSDTKTQGIAGKVAAELSGITDCRSDEWWTLQDNGATIHASIVGPITEQDQEIIEKVATEGTSSLRPPTKPKEGAGAKHLVVEVSDKHLILFQDPNSQHQLIGHIDYGYSGTPVQWRLVVDEGSSLFYVEPLLSDADRSDLVAFLERAWQRKPNLLFEGPPHSIEIPKTISKKHPVLTDFLAEQQAELTHPKNGLGLGLTIGRLWLDDTRSIAVSRWGMEIKELLRWTHEHQAVISAMGWYTEPDNRLDRTHAHSLFGFPPFEHYTGISVDTPAYANAVHRENAESVLLASFPSDVKP